MDEPRQPNDVIRFLDGTWTTKDITVVAGSKVTFADYIEEIKIKDHETISITAFAYDNGKDKIRNMTIALDGEVVLRQGTFSARGSKKGNCITLSGKEGNKTYNFRMYLMDDKFIFQRDVLEDDMVVEAQMSYLIRKLRS
jgi:hypothetical protein